jgi:hypothetical protein
VQSIRKKHKNIDEHSALYAASALSSTQRMQLTPADFDVKVLSKEERQKRRNKVIEDIEAMVGWGGMDSNAQVSFLNSQHDRTNNCILTLLRQIVTEG